MAAAITWCVSDASLTSAGSVWRRGNHTAPHGQSSCRWSVHLSVHVSNVSVLYCWRRWQTRVPVITNGPHILHSCCQFCGKVYVSRLWNMKSVLYSIAKLYWPLFEITEVICIFTCLLTLVYTGQHRKAMSLCWLCCRQSQPSFVVIVVSCAGQEAVVCHGWPCLDLVMACSLRNENTGMVELQPTGLWRIFDHDQFFIWYWCMMD